LESRKRNTDLKIQFLACVYGKCLVLVGLSKAIVSFNDIGWIDRTEVGSIDPIIVSPSASSFHQMHAAF
jgi:hypothetical protein